MLKLKTPLYATILLLGIVTLLNVWVANRIGLSPDEAHYALYADHLALSYYDHPPLVGWLQALIIPFSHSDFALRLWPLLFNLGSAIILYRLSTLFFPHEKRWFGFFCVAMMQAGIIINLLGLALIPQTLLIFFGLLTLFYLHKAIQHEKLIDFLLLGFCLGFSALSEYTAAFLALASVLYIITKKPQLLYNYKLYCTALLTLLCVLPILFWNYQHDWISFSYQQNHVLSEGHWSGKLFSLSQLAQIFCYTPALYIFGLLAVCTKPRYWRFDSVRLLVLFVVPTLLFFAYGAGYTFTLPHWTALAWLATIPLSVRYIYHHWQRTIVKILVWCSIIYSVLLILLLHVLASQAWLNLPLAQQPLRDLYGWQQAADVALYDLSTLPSIQLPKPILFVTNWSLASRLAWYSQHPVQIVGSEGNAQFTIWYGRPAENSNGIVVLPYGTSADLVGPQAGQFKSCYPLPQLMIYNHQKLVNSFNFYNCRGYQIK